MLLTKQTYNNKDKHNKPQKTKPNKPWISSRLLRQPATKRIGTIVTKNTAPGIRTWLRSEL